MKIKLDTDAIMPVRAHELDAGYDLFSRDSRIVPAGGDAVFDTGVHIQLDEGTAALIVAKSGLNTHQGITSAGLIDAGFTGSIKVKLYNHGKKDYNVNKGDKISQFTIIPIKTPTLELVENLDEFPRGENGYGSTGR